MRTVPKEEEEEEEESMNGSKKCRRFEELGPGKNKSGFFPSLLQLRCMTPQRYSM